MPRVSTPTVKYRCARCGCEVEAQVNPRRCAEQIDAMRDGPPLVCAGCADET